MTWREGTDVRRASVFLACWLAAAPLAAQESEPAAAGALAEAEPAAAAEEAPDPTYIFGTALEVTPPDRGDRIEAALDALDLGRETLPYDLDVVIEHLGADKKHQGGRLRWVLPTANGVEVRTDVPDALVRDAAAAMLAAGSRR